MDWYRGGVVKAIEQCRQQRSVFIVYIKDNTDASNQTDQSWNSQEVLQVLSCNSHVAIELIKGSVEYHQFSQLFPVLLTPCVFCIGLKGEQLAVRSGSLDATLLAATLEEAFLKHQSGTSSGSGPEVAKGGALEESSTSERKEEATTTTATESGSVSDEVDKQQRLEERRQQIRQRKEVEERQKEKERENARRRDGQEMAQWKKDKEELEKQQWMKERRKQKQEEQRAKQEILAKLEQDRRERAAQKKISTMKEEGGATVSQATPTVTSDSTRIQVKMPENKTTVLILSSSDSVGTLRDQIAEYMEVDRDTLSLACTYPRKELTTDLDSSQLTEHGLVPSGVVIVRLSSSGHSSFSSSTSSSDGSVLSLLWGAIMGLINLLVMVGVFIKNGVMSLFGTSNSSSDSVPSSSQYRNTRGGSSRIRRFNQDDFKEDDDEKRKNTYNGNSTQQL